MNYSNFFSALCIAAAGACLTQGAHAASVDTSPNLATSESPCAVSYLLIEEVLQAGQTLLPRGETTAFNQRVDAALVAHASTGFAGLDLWSGSALANAVAVASLRQDLLARRMPGGFFEGGAWERLSYLASTLPVCSSPWGAVTL